MPDTIHIYTDGAASGNPGPGGYGIVMLYKDHRKEVSEGYRLTTNNRMELLSVIVALKIIKKKVKKENWSMSSNVSFFFCFSISKRSFKTSSIIFYQKSTLECRRYW